mmetsp:Transcript_68786/g.192870  ORF Transcript_68786/g.192870 Transcript_68786/m.192870 type:complete len:257 (-) Transcript_68786:50-820(-)
MQQISRSLRQARGAAAARAGLAARARPAAVFRKGGCGLTEVGVGGCAKPTRVARPGGLTPVLGVQLPPLGCQLVGRGVATLEVAERLSELVLVDGVRPIKVEQGEDEIGLIPGLALVAEHAAEGLKLLEGQLPVLVVVGLPEAEVERLGDVDLRTRIGNAVRDVRVRGRDHRPQRALELIAVQLLHRDDAVLVAVDALPEPLRPLLQRLEGDHRAGRHGGHGIAGGAEDLARGRLGCGILACQRCGHRRAITAFAM